MHHALLLTLLAFLSLVITPAHAQPLESLIEEAVEDYNFQDNEEAENKFKHILELAPGNVTAHYYLGTLLMSKGKPNEAIPHFEHVFNAPTPMEGIKVSLAKAYQAAEKFDQALPIYKDIYDANIKNDGNAFQYAKALQTANHIDEAKAIYLRLIKEKSAYTEAANYQIGLCNYSLGSFVTAYDSFKAINPTSAYGDVAKQYMDALIPMTKPFSVYLSGENFYNDNPTGASSTALGLNAGNSSSPGHGWTIIGTVNSRQFEPSDKMRLKLGYLYFGILYSEPALRSNNFVGHFINPSISYVSSPTLNFELKGEFQYFNYSQQLLSKNYGATFTSNKKFKNSPHSIAVTMAYLKKAYTKSFKQNNQTSSLEYLNGDNYSVGIGGTLASSSGASFTANYKFSDEHTSKNTNQARDARFQDHNISANAYIPFSKKIFGKFLSRLSLRPSINYLKKNYINLQSVDTNYDKDGNPNTADLLIGKKVHSKTITAGIQLAAVISQEMGITLTGGYEYSKSTSNAASLTTKYNKYFASLGAAF